MNAQETKNTDALNLTDRTVDCDEAMPGALDDLTVADETGAEIKGGPFLFLPAVQKVR